MVQRVKAGDLAYTKAQGRHACALGCVLGTYAGQVLAGAKDVDNITVALAYVWECSFPVSNKAVTF